MSTTELAPPGLNSAFDWSIIVPSVAQMGWVMLPKPPLLLWTRTITLLQSM